ncbi:MAG: polysaccharide biosynthesis protein [Clostridia bacterium]
MVKRQSLIKGTFILVSANVLVKIIGAIFKIPLTNLIGASGISDFSIAYNLYAVMFVISTAGLPVAISKMVAESNSNGKNCDVFRIIKAAICIFCTVGLVFTLLLLSFADEICEIVGSETAYLSIIAVAPSVFLTTIVAILRGYYQGHHDMSKTAISQLIEAIFKLLIGYFFAKYLISNGYGVNIASAGAILGVTIGTLISAIYLCICIVFTKKRVKNNRCTSYSEIINKLFAIAIPITIGASVISLTGVVDMLTILKRLQYIGVNSQNASELFGAYNMSLTLYNLPQTVITAISISAIPVIAESQKSTIRVEKIVNTALFMTVTIAMPCSVGFVLLAKPLLDFLYYKRPDDVLMATPILVILGLAVVFVSVVTITNASLQAVSKPMLVVKSMIVGVVVKFIANYFLISVPMINISGAPLGTVLCFLTISLINLHKMRKIMHFNINFSKIFVKPVISSVVMGVVIKILEENFNMQNKISVIVLIFIGAVTYFGVLILIKGIKKEDIGLLTSRGL